MYPWEVLVEGVQGEQGGAVVEGGCMKAEMQCTPWEVLVEDPHRWPG